MAKAYTNCTSVRNGDRVSGDARSSPVVSYQLTPEEIAARYGPPAAPAAKKPFALDPRLWAPKKGGDDNMATKMTQQEALRMRDTADRLAPVTQPAKQQAATINPEFEAAVQAMVAADQSDRPAPTKRCSKCGETKPLDQYHKSQTMCKDCRKEYDAERMRKVRADKKAKQATLTAAGIAHDAIPMSATPAAAIPATPAIPAVPQAVKDYAAQQGIDLEVTGSRHMIGPSVAAVLGLLDEARRYRVVMSVEEA